MLKKNKLTKAQKCKLLLLSTPARTNDLVEYVELLINEACTKLLQDVIDKEYEGYLKSKSSERSFLNKVK